MSDENNALNEGAGEALPAENESTQQNDQVQEVAPEDKAKEEAAKAEQEQRKRNRTTEYIERLKRENAEMRRQLVEKAAPSTDVRTESSAEPTLEQFAYDVEKFTKAHDAWAFDQHFQAREKASRQAEDARRQADAASSYIQRATAFAADHPDFEEVVNTIPYRLPDEVQAAIMAHERGPEIAYYLGSNDDDAFQIASIRPDMAEAAVKRIASRLSATPQSAGQTPSKPVSKAPPPTPVVSGRSPAEVPPEKMTDAQWYAQRRAKRAS